MPGFVTRHPLRLAGLALGCLCATIAARDALAVPALQLNIPGATYYESYTIDVKGTSVEIVDSLFALEDSFILLVLGAQTAGWVDRITDVTLYIAFETGDYGENPGGSVTVTPEGGTSVVKGTDDATFGTPDGLGPHGVYSAYYLAFALPDLMVGSGTDVITDIEPGEDGTGTGSILDLTVEYDGFFYIHMDVAGRMVFADGLQSQLINAP